MGCMFREFSDMEGNRPFQPLLKALQKGIIKCLPHARRMMDAVSVLSGISAHSARD
jgi:hypothetical protein